MQYTFAKAADVIQERYGWSDECVFNELPVERITSLFVAIQEAKRKEFLEKMQISVYPLYLQHGERGTTFNDFIDSLGLSIKDPQEVVSAEVAVDSAKNIIRLLGRDS